MIVCYQLVFKRQQQKPIIFIQLSMKITSQKGNMRYCLYLTTVIPFFRLYYIHTHTHTLNIHIIYIYNMLYILYIIYIILLKTFVINYLFFILIKCYMSKWGDILWYDMYGTLYPHRR